MDQKGPFWSILAARGIHLGPFRSANRTLAIQEQKGPKATPQSAQLQMIVHELQRVALSHHLRAPVGLSPKIIREHLFSSFPGVV